MARKRQFRPLQLAMDTTVKAVVETFISQEKLPATYAETVSQWFLPLTEEILRQEAGHHGTFVIGVSGSQGSGKTTLASLLVQLLHSMAGLRCINLSIDDFYLTHAQRQDLAREVHPLLATRGVPGTHDVALALDTIAALKQPGMVAVPRFDKAVDDRLPQAQWPHIQAPMDVVVLEGWCLSVPAADEGALAEPVNTLERHEDPDGRWRQYVNKVIATDYKPFYDLVDFLVMLKAPSFEKVYEWRQTQEDKLAQRIGREGESGTNRIMSTEQLQRFIQHYERVTRHGLATLPEQADVVFQLTDQQTIATRL